MPKSKLLSEFKVLLLPGLAATRALGIEAFEMFCFINLIYQTAGELLHMVMGIMEMLRLNTKCECELD